MSLPDGVSSHPSAGAQRRASHRALPLLYRIQFTAPRQPVRSGHYLHFMLEETQAQMRKMIRGCSPQGTQQSGDLNPGCFPHVSDETCPSNSTRAAAESSLNVGIRASGAVPAALCLSHPQLKELGSAETGSGVPQLRQGWKCSSLFTPCTTCFSVLIQGQ